MNADVRCVSDQICSNRNATLSRVVSGLTMCSMALKPSIGMICSLFRMVNVHAGVSAKGEPYIRMIIATADMNP